MPFQRGKAITLQAVSTNIHKLQRDFAFHNHIDAASQIVQQRGVSRVTRTVRTHTGGASAPLRLSNAESYGVFTNAGAAAEAYFQLPPAHPGITYVFIVMDADGLRIVSAAGDFIRGATTVSDEGGYIRSTDVGASMALTAINESEWFITGGVGTWIIST